ncbi:MAG TPA: protein translocase subunit SecF [bacterium]|mgnify:CR=1 FL=1|nr:protein translocase subunit SecF [bacterium]HQG45294.1 protein translocase subunit SecF [bacterium]HQI50048.1 protein translocase subunit SecF [bacterium]HQJ62996.1 protein translocase subunit SecF [bacterium]
MEFFKKTNINFIGMRRITYAFSIISFVLAIIFLFINGGPNYGIDFTGGTSIQLKFTTPTDPGQIRSAISGAGFGDAEIKNLGEKSANTFIIRIAQMGDEAKTGGLILQELNAKLADHPYDVLSVTEIGPKIGGELRRGALYSVLVALIAMLIYISWRFEFKFAVGAVIALFHDVVFVLGIYTALGLEMSLTSLAAFLTIVGYSINDTIVVYDRIRENLKLMRRESLGHIMNVSVNQTLSRTLLTGVSTLVVLLVLILAGGEVIHGFALALFIGTIIGTYSSVFVASVLVLDWQNYLDRKKQAKTAARVAR